MNYLVESGFMDEIKCGDNFAFVLNEDNALISTEYKVLQSQTEGTFVKCMKVLYNGKVQLYYLTNGIVTFKDMVSSLDSEKFLAIVADLFVNIVSVKNNGFLSCQNIDIAFEHIFVNPLTYKVSLVYLPIGRRLYSDVLYFENDLRANLIKLIQEASNLSGTKVEQLKVDLSNGMLPLEGIISRTRKGTVLYQKQVGPNILLHEDKENLNGGNIKMVATNAPIPLEIVITKNEFVLGRKQELVDGVISFSKKISRVHCKVTREGNLFAVTDLESAGGTYVNGMRLQPKMPCTIKMGDKIRLSDIEFDVVMS